MAPAVSESKFDQPALADEVLRADEEILRKAKIGVDRPALIKFFGDRIPGDPDPARLALLIEQLGDAKYSVREKASKELAILGAAALRGLNEALDHPADLELQQRAMELHPWKNVRWRFQVPDEDIFGLAHVTESGYLLMTDVSRRRISEFNRHKKEVWSHQLPGCVLAAHKR